MSTSNFQEKLAGQSVAVLGLGYVGLPLACAVNAKNFVVGFDIDQNRIAELKRGFDRTLEVTSSELAEFAGIFTNDPAALDDVDIYILAIATPINGMNEPDLTNLVSACDLVGQYLSKDNLVILESTVFPGVSEDICIPILEFHSGLRSIIDFSFGYSPERINPGDSSSSLVNIDKIVSATCETSLKLIHEFYSSFIQARVIPVSSIKVAEAAKVIENTQRDVNIALINELAMICHELKIDTNEVIDAASTKWNFIPFRPGLVGGHCIGIDPYYLSHVAKKCGVDPKVILGGRLRNDSMTEWLCEVITKKIIADGSKDKISILILGCTFKENCPDMRNSRIPLVYKKLKRICDVVDVYDPVADPEIFQEIYGEAALSELHVEKKYDYVLICVAHEKFVDIGLKRLENLLVVPGSYGNIFDFKNIFGSTSDCYKF